MTVAERRLLKSLPVVLYLCAASWVAYAGLERTTAAKASSEKYREALKTLPRREADSAGMEKRIAELREAIGNVPGTERKPLPAFALEVRSLLSRHRIAPDGYQVVGSSGEETIEFRLKCETLAFLRFLKDASERNRGWDFPVISIRPDVAGSDSDIILRVAYAK